MTLPGHVQHVTKQTKPHQKRSTATFHQVNMQYAHDLMRSRADAGRS